MTSALKTSAAIVNDLKKPLLRGHLHQESFFVALGACLCLCSRSQTEKQWIASVVYSLGLLTLFGTSGLYHRIYWSPTKRALMKRLDHSAIFILIASTFTPICLLVLPPEMGMRLLIVIWTIAFFGILQSLFWTTAPRWLTSIFYVVAGWMALPYISELRSILGPVSFAFLVAGGIAYTVGALFYAIKKPNLFPGIFGYHEFFHVFTIFGAAFHFIVINRLYV